MSSAEVFRISGSDFLFALPISFVLKTASFKGKKGGRDPGTLIRGSRVSGR